MNIDDDLYEIESWEEYCKFCIKQGKIDVFKKKLSLHIQELNRPILEGLNAFAVKIRGEIFEQEFLKLQKLLNKPKKGNLRKMP